MNTMAAAVPKIISTTQGVVIMSSKIKWGGLAGIAAAVLLILSAIINQVTPIQSAYDSAAS
jgi:hypothetical protein